MFLSGNAVHFIFRWRSLPLWRNYYSLQKKITFKGLFINRDNAEFHKSQRSLHNIPRNYFELWWVRKKKKEKTFSSSFFFCFFLSFPLRKHLTCQEVLAVPGPGTTLPQRPRSQQRRSRAHKDLWKSLVVCFLESADTPAGSTASGQGSALGLGWSFWTWPKTDAPSHRVKTLALTLGQDRSCANRGKQKGEFNMAFL